MKLEVLESTLNLLNKKMLMAESIKNGPPIPQITYFLDVKLCLVIHPPPRNSKFDSSASNFMK